MGYIYKIYTQDSNKIYIGQTINPIQERFKQHLTRDYGTKLAQAFDKYGRNNFQIQLIEEVSNELLNEREKYWIKYFDSFYNGYNMTEGGQTTSYAVEKLKKPVEQRDKDTFELLATYESLAEAARALDFNNCESKRKNINKCCNKECHEVYGYRWNFVGEEPDKIKKGQARKIPVAMCDLTTGEILKTFDSAKSASIYLNKINGSQITACCKKRIQQAYGYLWRYINECK